MESLNPIAVFILLGLEVMIMSKQERTMYVFGTFMVSVGWFLHIVFCIIEIINK